VTKLYVNWSRVRDKADLNPALVRYTRYFGIEFKRYFIIMCEYS
jgi:hypothetical protein